MNTSADVALRYATLHDIPALVALVTSAYRGDARRAGWTTEADILDGAVSYTHRDVYKRQVPCNTARNACWQITA